MKLFTRLVVASALTAAPVLADTVTIGTLETYDPGSYTVDPAALQGFDRSLAEQLCARADLTCEWSILSSDQLWSALESGQIDVVMAGVSMDANVDDGFDRTLPYLAPDPFLHIGMPGTEWQMEGAVVAYVQDPAVTAYGQTSGATFTQYDTIEEALAAVRNGEMLSLFGERNVLSPIVEASAGELAVIGNRDEITIKRGVAMVLRADDVDLRFAFEDQIFEMGEEGSLNALIESWFGNDAARW